MSKDKYKVISQFRGYHNKEDLTNLPPGCLVPGSQNVLINQGERVATRMGYTLYGQANTALTPIESGYDWYTHLGTERHLRSYDDELEYLYVASDGTVTWRRLGSGFTSAAFNYAEFWNTTEVIDELLMVNGAASIYAWSGAITTYASSTVNTITKEGVTTWAEEGFYTTGTRTVVIDGITYTYTGGESTTTLTGVTPDPTLGAHAVGAVVHQGLKTTANGAMTAMALQSNDLIGVLNNQIYVGDFHNRQVYVSKINSYTDYSFSSPRTPGQGAILTLDSTPVGFVPQENVMYISAGLNFWFETQLTLGADQTTEALTVKRLKTNAQAGAQSQALISQIKNDVIFVSNEPTMDTLGRVIGVVITPQTGNISDPIKNDFDTLDFTGGCCFYFQNYMYVATPVSNQVWIFNIARKEWEAPQVLPISRFAIINGELYGHSSQVPETYKLFDGWNDNGNPIEAIAVFSYEQYGDRANTKNFTEWYNEGYITPNTDLTLTLRYDYNGANGERPFTISGSDERIIVDTSGAGSLGKQSLGVRSLAGRGATIDESLPPKFRVIETTSQNDFYELQSQYYSNGIDQHWELLCVGGDVVMSTSTNADITQ